MVDTVGGTIDDTVGGVIHSTVVVVDVVVVTTVDDGSVPMFSINASVTLQSFIDLITLSMV